MPRLNKEAHDAIREVVDERLRAQSNIAWEIAKGFLIITSLCGVGWNAAMYLETRGEVRSASQAVESVVAKSDEQIEAIRDTVQGQEDLLGKVRQMLDQAEMRDLANEWFTAGASDLPVVDTQIFQGVAFQLTGAERTGPQSVIMHFRCINKGERETEVVIYSVEGTRVHADDGVIYRGVYISPEVKIGARRYHAFLKPDLPIKYTLEVHDLGAGVSMFGALDLEVRVDGIGKILPFQGIRFE